MIVNSSFSTGTFPEKLKYSKVLPIHKSGSKFKTSIYRPISVLPIFDKIFEKLMHTRLASFLDKNQIISPSQYGFQKHKSTATAIQDLVSKIAKSKHKRHYSSVVFLDFAKAFDTVDHNILLAKLNHYGIRGIALKWFADYLSNRQQSVFILEALSKALYVKFGVPQGSILGPILFLLYINDIVHSSDEFEYTLFADDTSLYTEHSNQNDLIVKINRGLLSVSDWLTANKLSLNVGKSNMLLFKPPNSTNSSTLNVSLNGTEIKQETVVKYLGIKIDNKLSWCEHISYIHTKISQGIGVICKLRNLLPQNSLKNIYYSFCQSYLTYGLILWGHSNSSQKTNLSKLLNKCLKLMSFSNARTDTKNLYMSLKILNLNQLLILARNL